MRLPGKSLWCSGKDWACGVQRQPGTTCPGSHDHRGGPEDTRAAGEHVWLFLAFMWLLAEDQQRIRSGWTNAHPSAAASFDRQAQRPGDIPGLRAARHPALFPPVRVEIPPLNPSRRLTRVYRSRSVHGTLIPPAPAFHHSASTAVDRAYHQVFRMRVRWDDRRRSARPAARELTAANTAALSRPPPPRSLPCGRRWPCSATGFPTTSRPSPG